MLSERDADGRCQHGWGIVDAVADEQRLRPRGFLPHDPHLFFW